MDTDFLNVSDLTGLTEGYAASQGSSLNTGDLRRRYDAIPLPRVSELSIATEPFFGFASKFHKKSVNDSQFKFAEKRLSFHKRYAYVIAHGTDVNCSISTDAQLNSGTNFTVNDTYYFKMATDYKSDGNIGIVYDERASADRQAFTVGASGTRPEFFIPGQKVKIPIGTNNAATVAAAFQVTDYLVVRVEAVTQNTNDVVLKTIILKTASVSTNLDLCGWGATTTVNQPLSSLTAKTLAALRIYDQLERARCYVTGNAYAQGSGYPQSWHDKPYSTGYGQTQIWKHSAFVDGTTEATEFKYEMNEYQRIWGSKLFEHKADIEKDSLFSAQGSFTDSNGDTIYTTQGAVDYIMNYGNIFKLYHGDKSADDFLQDMSTFLDVRYNNANGNLFMCDKYTLNWLIRLDGYSYNNMMQAGDATNKVGRSTMTYMGWRDVRLGKKAQIRMHTISTPYGDMNCVYNPHLDGTEVAIVAVNLNHVWFRPLKGNGKNRDTKVYLGVQTINNSGIDGRVDLILTEAGWQWEMPECHAIWVRQYS